MRSPQAIFRGRRGDFLNIDAACRADHCHRRLRLAVHHDTQIVFFFDGQLGHHQHLLHGQPLDIHAQHTRGSIARLFRGIAKLNATSPATPTNIDLGLNDHRHPKVAGNLLGLLRRRGNLAGLNGYPIAAEDVLRLILVNLHFGSLMVASSAPPVVTQP